MNTWTSAAPLRCGRHGLLYAVCRECFPTADPLRPAGTDAEPWTPTDYGSDTASEARSGAWLGAVILAVVFALGLAVGWWLR